MRPTLNVISDDLITRIVDDRVVIDPRTILPGQTETVIEAILEAVSKR